MNNLKKIIALALALLIMLPVFAGCAPKDTEPAGETEQPVQTGQPAEETPAEEASFDYSQGLDEGGYWQGVKALELVTLPEYEGVKIPADIHTVSEEALQTEIDSLLESYADLEHLTDRAVADGDTVNIDYVGSVDGVEFEGGNTSGMGTLVTIGVTQYIDDFLAQLVGHMPGETINVNVTFPEDYGKEELNGKEALFVTTINYIEGTEYINPVLDDAFVTQNLKESYGWQTVEEMREGIRKELADASIAQFLQEYILENTEVSSIPQVVMDYQMGSYRSFHEMQASYYGMEMADYFEANQVKDMDELLASVKGDIEENAKFVLIIQAMAEDMGIAPTDEELDSFFTENGITDPEYYLESYGKPYFKMAMISQSVLERMTENAVME